MLSKNIDKNLIMNLFDEGKSPKEISKILNISLPTISYWKKKIGLSSILKRYNWNEIQEAHLNGESYSMLRAKFGVTKRAIEMAKKRGDFITRELKTLPLEERKKRKRIKNREAWMRYYSRKKYQTPADEDIKALQEFYYNCPPGYEVDHIIPISKGGLHSLSNLQYLTKTENRVKSNKIMGNGVTGNTSDFDFEKSRFEP